MAPEKRGKDTGYMMRRINRLLALLMTLCLLASLAVVPAAAAGESVEALTSQLNEAREELRKAEEALKTATKAVEDAEKAVENAKNRKNQAETDKANAEDVLSNQEASEEDKTSAQEKLNAANEILSTIDTEIGNAQSALTTAQNAADIEGKTEEKNTAEKRVTDLEKALKDAQDALEEENKPTTPGSSDLGYSSSVDFGKQAKGSTNDLTRTFTITNRTKYDMTLSSPSVGNYYTVISGATGTLSAGSSTTVTLRLDSTSSTGTYNSTFTVYASFVEGTGSYTISIPVYAQVVDSNYSISVDPTSKDLGKLSEGYEEKTAKEKEVTVTVQNKGASDVRMDGVKGNDHFTVTAVNSESITLKNGEKTDYKIVPKKGLAIGTYTDTIVFQTREGATASFKATVAVEKKLAPLSVEPASLNFGTAEEGYTALTYQTITLKNNTDSSLLMTQPTSYSYEISALPQTVLTAGGSMTLNIRPRTGLPANKYDGIIEFNSNTEQAKLTVQFTVTRPAGPSTFNDVASGSTFAADIAYVSQKGLMSGVGGGKFNPQAPITRGQLVTILYRLEGQPAVSGLGFSDVAAGSYCEKAVKWAAATGVTTGGADGLFRPNDPITREQMATFLYRYNQYKGFFVVKLADLSTFPDAGSIASYAKDALSWANGSGLINGTGDGRLNPSGGATRGQAAAILHRYCVSIGQ